MKAVSLELPKFDIWDSHLADILAGLDDSRTMNGELGWYNIPEGILELIRRHPAGYWGTCVR